MAAAVTAAASYTTRRDMTTVPPRGIGANVHCQLVPNRIEKS